MSPTRRSTRDRIDAMENLLDEALQETFPASDLVAYTHAPSVRPAAPPDRLRQARQKNAFSPPRKPVRQRSGNKRPAHAGSG